MKTNIDFSKIDNIVFGGIDHRDYPDYCDAFIESCDIDGREATEAELYAISENGEFVYDKLMAYLF